MRRITLAAASLVLAALPGLAAAQAPSDRFEGYREQMRNAQAHVQIEVVSAAIPRDPGLCTVDGVVKRAFRGADIAPVGRTVRVRMGCGGTPGSRPSWDYTVSYTVHRPTERMAVWPRDIAPGRTVEIYLNRVADGPADAFLRAGDAILVVEGPTDAPRFPMPPRPAGFRPAAQAGSAPSRPEGQPPLFPTRDVTITFRHSAVTTGEVRGIYDAAGWRVRTEHVSNARGGIGISDAFAGTRTDLNPNAREFTVRHFMSRDGVLAERLGLLSRSPNPTMTAEGEETVAGLRCTVWRIVSGVPGEPEARACVTADGVQLRRSDSSGETEVTSVRYGPVPTDAFRIPRGWTEARPEGR